MHNSKLKYTFIIILSLLIIPSQVFSLSAPSNPRSIKIKKIATIPLGSGAGAAQSIEVTDKYIVITESRERNSTATTSAVQIVDKNTLSVYKTIMADDLGHGNDVAYNSADNEIYLLNGSNPTYRIYDSDTLEFKNNAKVSDLTAVSSITYDSSKGQFYLGQYAQGICHVKDRSFNTNSTFNIAAPTGYVTQSFEFYDNNLYYILFSEATADNNYNYTPSAIYVFNRDGQVVKNLTTTGITERHEIEGMAVDELTGKVYFVYNNWGHASGVSPIEIWEMDEDVKIRLNINGGTLDSTHGSSIALSGSYITVSGSDTVLTLKNGAATPDYGIPDYNNSSQINIVKTGYHIVATEEWKLSSGKVFDQSKKYYSGDFCNQLLDDCTVDLYANWVANTYTVKFDSNGGSGTMSNQTMTYDQTAALSTNSFTKSGYKFTGWNTKVDGSGSNYAAGANVRNLMVTNGGNVTLYAMWDVDDGSSTEPSSNNNDDNITDNPQTGTTGIVVAWIVGLIAVGFSIWYYRKTYQNFG